MIKTDFMIANRLYSQWFKHLRENPEDLRNFSECFWESQMQSKAWLLSELDPAVGKKNWWYDNIYVFGGWYGVFTQILLEHINCGVAYNIDIDPKCAVVGLNINVHGEKFIPVTCPMEDYYDLMPAVGRHHYDTDKNLIINTSTEHVSQEVYEKWAADIPDKSKVILQGNNLSGIGSHIRTFDTLEEWCEMNGVDESFSIVQERQVDNVKRYMAIREPLEFEEEDDEGESE